MHALPLLPAGSYTRRSVNYCHARTLTMLCTSMPLQSLLEAAHQGNLALVQQLCASGMDLNAARSPLPPMTPPLIEAVCARRRDIIECLLDRSASLQARDVAYGAQACAHA